MLPVNNDIVVIDSRYGPDVTLQALVDNNKADIILFIFHQNNCSPELVKYLSEFLN